MNILFVHCILIIKNELPYSTRHLNVLLTEENPAERGQQLSTKYPIHVSSTDRLTHYDK